MLRCLACFVDVAADMHPLLRFVLSSVCVGSVRAAARPCVLLRRGRRGCLGEEGVKVSEVTYDAMNSAPSARRRQESSGGRPFPCSSYGRQI